MSSIRIGCQTYTWQMSYEKYKDQLPQILHTIEEAGFSGVEPEVCMMGPYYDDVARFKKDLQDRNLELAALCLALPWASPKETESEREEADKVMRYLEAFPGTILALAQLPGDDRSNLRERQRYAIDCINEIGRRASDRGIVTAFHPNSPPGSIFRTADDYKVLMDGLDASVIGYVPDAGHIANGGMDVLQVFKDYRPLIKHAHFKDFNDQGEWAAMGEGIIDFPGIVSFLKETGYDGWIMVEEESTRAETEPNEVTLENGAYVKRDLQPIIS